MTIVDRCVEYITCYGPQYASQYLTGSNRDLVLCICFGPRAHFVVSVSVAPLPPGIISKPALAAFGVWFTVAETDISKFLWLRLGANDEDFHVLDEIAKLRETLDHLAQFVAPPKVLADIAPWYPPPSTETALEIASDLVEKFASLSLCLDAAVREMQDLEQVRKAQQMLAVEILRRIENLDALSATRPPKQDEVIRTFHTFPEQDVSFSVLLDMMDMMERKLK